MANASRRSPDAVEHGPPWNLARRRNGTLKQFTTHDGAVVCHHSGELVIVSGQRHSAAAGETIKGVLLEAHRRPTCRLGTRKQSFDGSGEG